MKKLLAVLSLTLLMTKVEAALISRTYTYTSGNTISANENNTNENTIYNEFNGNISAANILDGSITNADIADTQLTRSKFAAVVQSTFTYLDTIGSYRRPQLNWISVTTVDIEANTGTSNQTCVYFPDERRCVTENTASTSINRRFIITESGSVSGTKNSGLRTGYIATANTWYALYLVKTTDVSTDFVIIGDTLAPIASNYAALNSFYGTNSWVYVGTIAYGDNGGATTSIAKFTQSGNRFVFLNALNDGVGTPNGVRVANTAGAASLTWTYAAGNTISSGQVPANILIGTVSIDQNASTAFSVGAQAAGLNFILIGGVSGTGLVRVNDMDLSLGIVNTPSGATAQNVVLSNYLDAVLGVGFNPQI